MGLKKLVYIIYVFRCVLCLSLRPLLALLIAFREWDTFDFGTAKRKGGKRSSRDCSEGIDHDVRGNGNDAINGAQRENDKRLGVCRRARAIGKN